MEYVWTAIKFRLILFFKPLFNGSLTDDARKESVLLSSIFN